MKNLLIFILFLEITSCVQSQTKDNAIQTGSSVRSSSKEAVATFGQGCFWHSEIVFQSLVGVRDAVSGYAGGDMVNPSYEEVCSGSTGHAEVVQVYYNPDSISYKKLVQAFFASQDPTTLNRQGNDKGTQYRSVAFYRNENEKKIVENEISELTAEKKYSAPIVTEVKSFKNFYPAEDYHQEYISLHPENGYVQNVSIPDFMEFKKEFKANYK